MKPCHVVIEYCKPIYVKDLDKADQRKLGVYTQNIIRETIEKNKALL